MQQSIVGCAIVQVSYCTQVRAAPDTALTCQQQQQAKDSCRRSCGLCYDKVDSSSLVWYNQAQSLGSTPAPTPTLTPTPALSQVEPKGASSSPTRAYSQAQASSSLQGIKVNAGGNQLDDQPDSLADDWSRPAYDQAQADGLQSHDIADAVDSQQVESSADGTLMQPATAGVAADGKKAGLTSNTTHESQVDAAAGPVTSQEYGNTVEQLAVGSGDGNVLRAAAFPAAPERHRQVRRGNIYMHVVPANQDSWQKHLSDPFCKSLLCLCALLLTCIVCLFRGRFQRRKVLR